MTDIFDMAADQLKDSVIITNKEYQKLLEDSAWLSALEDAGVDNWQGIEYAIKLYQEKLDN